MNSLFTYLIELNISITVFYIIYQLIFKKDSNFNNRRAFLLFAMGMSFLVPFININFAASLQNIGAGVIQLEEFIHFSNADTAEHIGISMLGVVSTIYILVTLFFLGKLFFSIAKIIRSILHSEKMQIHGITVHLNSKLHASSFFNVIFIDPSLVDEKDLEHILKHESCHAKLFHSADRIMAELLLGFSWFNPLSWMLRKSIIENHEYQADNQVIEHGTDQISYQLTILNQHIGSASISNQFSNQIKKRIKMLNKNYKKGSFWKSFLLAPISILLLFFLACNSETGVEEEVGENLKSEEVKKASEGEVFYIVEEMPQWPGKEDFSTGIRDFIAKNLDYPDIAKDAGAEGKVSIYFIITRTGDVIVADPSMLAPEKDDDGNIGEVVVVAYKPLNPDQSMPEEKIVQAFKDEATRIVELLPDMIPGKQRGKAVNVIFKMPLTFKLQ